MRNGIPAVVAFGMSIKDAADLRKCAMSRFQTARAGLAVGSIVSGGGRIGSGAETSSVETSETGMSPLHCTLRNGNPSQKSSHSKVREKGRKKHHKRGLGGNTARGTH